MKVKTENMISSKTLDIVPNALVCSNPLVRQWVLTELDRLYSGSQDQHHFNTSKHYESPMVMPMSWHPRRAIQQLESHLYFVTEKYDGVRYFLFLTQRNNRQYAFMINRAGTLFSVAISCASDFFEKGGSLFEGELVFNSQSHKQEFYVFDVVALCGSHVHTIENGHLFEERKEWIRELFGGIPYDSYIVNQSTNWKVMVETNFRTRPDWCNKIVSLGNHYSLQFFPKLFYKLEGYDPVFMTRKDIPNDGYIFTPNYCPIGPPQINDQPRIWKWKPHTTIDCWLCSDNPTIYLIHKRQREPLYSVRVRGRLFACRWTEEGGIKLQDSWHVVECVVEVHDTELMFIPLRIRHDKTFPNSIKTFQKCLPTIFDPTPIEHVFQNPKLMKINL